MKHRRTFSRITTVFTLMAICALVGLSAAAQVPQTINEQGYLTDADGNPVNGNVEMTFTFYGPNDEVVSTHTQTITVTNGRYAVQIPLTIEDVNPVSMGITIGGDAELSPREKLVSVPYALLAEQVNGITVKDATIETENRRLILKRSGGKGSPMASFISQNQEPPYISWHHGRDGEGHVRYGYIQAGDWGEKKLFKFQADNGATFRFAGGSLGIVADNEQSFYISTPNTVLRIYEDLQDPSFIRFRANRGKGFMFSPDDDGEHFVIRTDIPESQFYTTLKVSKMLYANEGITFPDGTVQTTAATGSGSSGPVSSLSSPDGSETAMQVESSGTIRVDSHLDLYDTDLSLYSGAQTVKFSTNPEGLTIFTGSNRETRILGHAYVQEKFGVGDSNPTQKMSIDGAVEIGDTSVASQGALRYHNGDFEGFTPEGWKTLSSDNSSVSWEGIADKPSEFTPGGNRMGDFDIQGDLFVDGRAHFHNPVYLHSDDTGVAEFNVSNPFEITSVNQDGANIRMKGYDSANQRHDTVLEFQADEYGAEMVFSDGFEDNRSNTDTIAINGKAGAFGGSIVMYSGLINTNEPLIELKTSTETTSAASIMVKGDLLVKDDANDPERDISLGFGGWIYGYGVETKFVRAEEVIVETTGADFVFEDGYDLMPLHEIEQHIDTKKHLPGIPSAQQMQDKGMSVGEMQTLLLQKVEELTLHVIEQDKKLTSLQQENEALKQQLETFRTQGL